MRFLTNCRDKVVFFCDDCGKVMDEQDPGMPFWDNYERFVDTIGTDDAEPTLFLCQGCFEACGGPEQEWLDADLVAWIRDETNG